jgi:carboxypeptidase Q
MKRNSSRHWLMVWAAGGCLAAIAWAEPGKPTEYTAVVDGKETPAPAIAMGDEAVVKAILEEGKERNQVMRHLRHLTQEIGPRLTGSTNAETANHWCREQYENWGLANPHVEEWGQIPVRFDRGPSTGVVMLRREDRAREGEEATVTYEKIRDLEFSTSAWTFGTDGPTRARIIKEPATPEDFERVRESLAGAWVLIGPTQRVGVRGFRGAVSGRYEVRKAAKRKVAEGVDPASLSVPERIALEPVAGYVSTSRDERVWTGGINGWRELNLDELPREPHVVIRGSDYDFINSRVADREPIELEFDLQHTLTPGPIPVYNTIAEIPGTDLAAEVVIVSAHLDSWNGPGSQGCTDNGTGSSVTLEAARILSAVGARPRRTIRFINWTGEEQGLLGSRAYVEKHKEEMEKVSCVFVDDGGTNYQGGLGAPLGMVDMLAAATAPVNNLFWSETDKKYLNVNVRPVKRRMPGGGGSDHVSFNNAGVPGFFWDEVGRADYQYGWHTQHDKFDLAVEEYLVQSSTCTAVTAYRLACADTLLPRPGPDVKDEDGGQDGRPQRGRGQRPARGEGGDAGGGAGGAGGGGGGGARQDEE